ncbi:hypothetical protein [Myroides odoratus]|uniref:Ig-like domain-containing protein n=1 Tax=Myroides odoratus TaxID=256 RepID=A0A9Q6ZBW7_MYROD|nr:hypothetical protein [Myroides odoratus]EHQ43476.1 hypothetical protein Myrod_2655 [Myroides odoratus DSM 2801]EKB06143.1 hypothetical protein HMPREF9716_02519 [Myroides odoratus CIP 103059]QQU00810.1 hypothetical protein I6I88_03315 [Myroides odoratus]WQD56948.1 hypothetical protein U0010_15710 [Myroides odoratus]STZ30755.1 Uncharacterised protein [Myroides odoratus]
MKNGVLNIKVDYKPLNAYKNVVVKSGSTRQNYNANTRYFEPDRRIDPYVVLIECGVNDTHKLAEGLVNEQLTDVSWKISSPKGYTEIIATDKEFRIGTGADKGMITIFKNVSDLEPVTLLFTARFMEPTTKRVVNFQESFTLITLPIAEAPLLVETAAPVGYNLFPTQNNQGLICQADLVQGSSKKPTAYWWYKGTTLLTEANGYKGTAKSQLFVPSTALTTKGDVFKCEIADCSAYFNQLVDQKVEGDAQVKEWRDLYQLNGENYYTRSNNWIKAWITATPGIASASDSALFAIPIPKGGGSWVLSGDVSGTTILRSGYIKTNVIIGAEVFNSNRDTILPRVIDVSNDATYIVVQVVQSYADKFKESLKVEKGNKATPWSPSKEDLQTVLDDKTKHYKTTTSLPENYRPNPKPAKLYTADFMLMKKLPAYTADVLYPTTVSPESTTVQIEMVLNTNDGVIKQPEQFFSVGWLKQANGTFKYKGFKVKIAIADIKALNDANKQLDYELREDLTLKA